MCIGLKIMETFFFFISFAYCIEIRLKQEEKKEVFFCFFYTCQIDFLLFLFLIYPFIPLIARSFFCFSLVFCGVRVFII